MNRDKSPKRRAKSADNFYTAFDIVKNYVRFHDLVRVYMTAKSLWPLFNGITICIHGFWNLFVPSLALWQELLECHRYEELLVSHVDIYRKRLSIVSAALRGTGVTNITRLLGVELLNQDMICAAALNGKKEFFDKYLKAWISGWNIADIFDFIPPLFSGESNAAYNKQRRGCLMRVCDILHYTKMSIKYRLVNGIVHCNTILRDKRWISSPKGFVSQRLWFIRFRDDYERKRASQLILMCREWGHPKALRLITTFLEPMAKELE